MTEGKMQWVAKGGQPAGQSVSLPWIRAAAGGWFRKSFIPIIKVQNFIGQLSNHLSVLFGLFRRN